MNQAVSNQETLITDTDNTQYSFTIVEGKVIAATIHFGDESFPLPIGPGESYTLDGKDVLYKTADDFGSSTTRYTDADGDGRYKLGSIEFGELPEGALYSPTEFNFELDNDSAVEPGSVQSAEPEYSFTIVDGKVTAVTEHIGDESFPLPIVEGESYTLDGKDVLYKTADDFGSSTTRYTDADGDGRYKLDSIEYGELPEGALYSPTEFNFELDNDSAVEPGSVQFAEPEYSFTIVDGKVTGVTEHVGEESFSLPVGEGESYTLDGKDILYNSADNFGSITIRYTDADGDGRFKIDSIDFGELPEGALYSESIVDLDSADSIALAGVSPDSMDVAILG